MASSYDNKINEFYIDYAFSVDNTDTPANFDLAFPSMVHNIKANKAVIDIDQCVIRGEPQMTRSGQTLAAIPGPGPTSIPTYLDPMLSQLHINCNIPSSNLLSADMPINELIPPSEMVKNERYRIVEYNGADWPLLVFRDNHIPVQNGMVITAPENVAAPTQGADPKVAKSGTNVLNPRTVGFNQHIIFNSVQTSGDILVNQDDGSGTVNVHARTLRASQMQVGRTYRTKTAGTAATTDWINCGAVSQDAGQVFTCDSLYGAYDRTTPITDTPQDLECYTVSTEVSHLIQSMSYESNKPDSGVLCANPFANTYQLSIEIADPLSGGRLKRTKRQLYESGLRTMRMRMKVCLLPEPIIL